MSRSYQSIVLLALVAILAACGGSNGGDAKAAVGAQLSDSARFDKGYRKKGCDLLTAELVGATFGIPAADLQQVKIMGCSYLWKSDTEKIEAGVSLVQAHSSEVAAAEWFARAARSKTAEEMTAEMKKISEQLSNNKALDTEANKAVAKGVLAMVPSKAVNFEDLAGVGDQARINDEGSVYVRVDNLTFIVGAYKGAVAPPLDLKGVDLKDMVKVAKKHDKEWAQKTAAQRKEDGRKLARAIVTEL